MKILRILSGLHAGAHVQLAAGRHAILRDGADLPAEGACTPVRLIDWEGPAALVEVAAGGRDVMLSLAARSDADAPPAALPWPDREPLVLGGLTVCLVAADAPQVSDQALLAMLAEGPPPGARRARRPVWASRSTAIGAGLLMAVSGLYGMADMARAPKALAAQRPLSAGQLNEAFAAKGLTALHARQQQGQLLVEGMLRDAADAESAHQVVARLQARAGDKVLESWQVADDVASTIAAALRVKVEVRYLGDGGFSVTGTVKRPDDVRAAIARLKADLGPAVREISSALVASAEPVKTASSMAIGSLQYVERSDGTKAFSAAKEAR